MVYFPTCRQARCTSQETRGSGEIGCNVVVTTEYKQAQNAVTNIHVHVVVWIFAHLFTSQKQDY